MYLTAVLIFFLLVPASVESFRLSPKHTWITMRIQATAFHHHTVATALLTRHRSLCNQPSNCGQSMTHGPSHITPQQNLYLKSLCNRLSLHPMMPTVWPQRTPIPHGTYLTLALTALNLPVPSGPFHHLPRSTMPLFC